MQKPDHYPDSSSGHYHIQPRLLQNYDRQWSNLNPSTPFQSESILWTPQDVLNSINATETGDSSLQYHHDRNTTSPSYISTNSSVNETTYSPLLNSPLSPTNSQSSPELYRLSPTPTYQFLQPSLMAKSEGSELTLFSSPMDLHHSHSLSFESESQRWERNHTTERKQTSPSPVIRASIESRMRVPYPLSSRLYGATKPFILKLGFLLSREDLYGDVVRWDASGTTFIITVSSRFTKEVLPELFSHSSFTAFTRQLTTYSFSHLKPMDLEETEKLDSRGFSIWKHIYFTRGDTTTLNRLLPRPSRARSAEKKNKMERSTLEAYSNSFLANKLS